MSGDVSFEIDQSVVQGLVGVLEGLGGVLVEREDRGGESVGGIGSLLSGCSDGRKDLGGISNVHVVCSDEVVHLNEATQWSAMHVAYLVV